MKRLALLILVGVLFVVACEPVVTRNLDGSLHPTPTSVLGPPSVSARTLAEWYFTRYMLPKITDGRPETNPCFYVPDEGLAELTKAYIEQGEIEGVRGDIAFAQSVLETGAFCFPGGQVRPEDYNFGGLGATDSGGGRNVARFPSMEVGVRAQMQHLVAYASKDRLCGPPCFDLRFDLVRRGTGTHWNQYGNGVWASSTNDYGGRILRMFSDILWYRDNG